MPRHGDGFRRASRPAATSWSSFKNELDVLRRYAEQGGEPPEEGVRKSKSALMSSGKAKTTFQIVGLPREFSAVDRRRLESAVKALLDQIE